MSNSVLQFDNVRFSYRGDWLKSIKTLHGVSFAVPQGSAFGFLGANGAGKSTSIKLTVGLLLGHEGRAELFGKPLGNDDARRRVGYLPEQPYFYENLNVGEYLTYLGRLSGMRGADLKAAVDRVCGMLDLDDLRTHKLGSFSKGMRQRFGLAQAILHKPDLLILDEPFSGLDPLWRARFREIMASERQRGATLFFSTHILSDVEHLCDHYAVIDHGHMLEQGRLSDLVKEAPLMVVAQGPALPDAIDNGDGTWTLHFPEADRDKVVEAIHVAGARIQRLQREHQALEDWFVNKVRGFHAAGNKMEAQS